MPLNVDPHPLTKRAFSAAETPNKPSAKQMFLLQTLSRQRRLACTERPGASCFLMELSVQTSRIFPSFPRVETGCLCYFRAKEPRGFSRRLARGLECSPHRSVTPQCEGTTQRDCSSLSRLQRDRTHEGLSSGRSCSSSSSSTVLY